MRAVLARGEESLLPRCAFPPSVDVRRHGRRADVREVAAAALRRRRVAARAGFENYGADPKRSTSGWSS